MLFLSFKVKEAKVELDKANDSYKESVKMGSKLSELKKVYTKKLNLSSFKSASLTQKRNKTTTTITSKSIDIKVLNSLMSRILNGSYEITAMRIKRLNESKVSLYLEIK